VWTENLHGIPPSGGQQGSPGMLIPDEAILPVWSNCNCCDACGNRRWFCKWYPWCTWPRWCGDGCRLLQKLFAEKPVEHSEQDPYKIHRACTMTTCKSRANKVWSIHELGWKGGNPRMQEM
jgi:hypothetical protein